MQICAIPIVFPVGNDGEIVQAIANNLQDPEMSCTWRVNLCNEKAPIPLHPICLSNQSIFRIAPLFGAALTFVEWLGGRGKWIPQDMVKAGLCGDGDAVFQQLKKLWFSFQSGSGKSDLENVLSMRLSQIVISGKDDGFAQGCAVLADVLKTEISEFLRVFHGKVDMVIREKFPVPLVLPTGSFAPKSADVVITPHEETRSPLPQLEVTACSSAIRTEKSARYAVYRSTLRWKDYSWSVSHRYSEFLGLRDALKATLGSAAVAALGEFPKKTFFRSGGSKKSVVSHRITAFEAFLRVRARVVRADGFLPQAVLEAEATRPLQEVADFVGYRGDPCRNTTPTRVAPKSVMIVTSDKHPNWELQAALFSGTLGVLASDPCCVCAAEALCPAVLEERQPAVLVWMCSGGEDLLAEALRGAAFKPESVLLTCAPGGSAVQGVHTQSGGTLHVVGWTSPAECVPEVLEFLQDYLPSHADSGSLKRCVGKMQSAANLDEAVTSSEGGRIVWTKPVREVSVAEGRAGVKKALRFAKAALQSPDATERPGPGPVCTPDEPNFTPQSEAGEETPDDPQYPMTIPRSLLRTPHLLATPRTTDRGMIALLLTMAKQKLEVEAEGEEEEEEEGKRDTEGLEEGLMALEDAQMIIDRRREYLEGLDPALVCEVLLLLGQVQLQIGDKNLGVENVKEAAEMCEKHSTIDRYLLFTAGDLLGGEYEERKEYITAATWYEKTLAARRKIRSPLDSHFGSTLQSLACMYDKLDDVESAVPLYLEALQVQRESHSEDLPVTLHDLAELYETKLEKISEAKGLYEEALEINIATLSPNHPEIAATYHALGDLHGRLEELSVANRMYTEALLIRRSICEPIDAADPDSLSDLVATLHNMGQVRERMGSLANAWNLLKEAVELEKRLLDPDDIDRTMALKSLVSVGLRKLGEVGSAAFRQELRGIVEEWLRVLLLHSEEEDSEVKEAERALAKVAEE